MGLGICAAKNRPPTTSVTSNRSDIADRVVFRPRRLVLALVLLAACTTEDVPTDPVDGSEIDCVPQALDRSPTDPSNPGETLRPLVFVFAGESNAGGLGLNSDALPTELGVRDSVQILDLYSGDFDFEPLDIGFNNLIDHAGLSDNEWLVPNPPNDILVHGMELGLANAVEAGAFPGRTSVYLIKTGQGGSPIASWGVDGVYWTKFLERIAAAKRQLPGNARWIVWYSQGINDAYYDTPMDIWKETTVAHLSKLKAALPDCQIIFTEFQSMPAKGGYPKLNDAIREVVARDPALASVSTAGAATRDINHWSYAGLRDIVVPALVAATRP
jgi:hypothetical protein